MSTEKVRPIQVGWESYSDHMEFEDEHDEKIASVAFFAGSFWMWKQFMDISSDQELEDLYSDVREEFLERRMKMKARLQ